MRLYDTDENGRRFLVPSKFQQDANGHYWECRAVIGGRKLWVPAPPWAGNINAYIFEGPNIYAEARDKPLCNVPMLRLGCVPRDDGNLILSDEEKDELLRTDPLAEKFLRPFMNGKEFINNVSRWCLWLLGAEPADIRKCPRVLERIEGVRKFRLASKREATRKQADTPMLFSEIRYSTTDYLAVPIVSSERRRYIPIDWVSHEVIPGGKIHFCSNATLYQFGVMMSSVHMAWVRIVSGRLEMRYSYSNTIDYNCFPWPDLRETHPHRLAVEKTAQAILGARALYPRSSLADLYDERTMPPELRKAHNANDEAVMAAYGFTRHYEDERLNDEDIATSLLYRYKELTGCREYSESYPNRELWEAYYGDEDGENEDEYEE